DGALLACKGPDNTVQVWDVAAGKEIGSFKGHEGTIAALAFTPDGKRLASGSGDTTVLVWNAASLKREPPLGPLDLQAQETTELWTELIGDDGGKAWQSIRKLAAAPKQAVPLLREQVKPAVPADPKKLERLLNELGSDEFEERSAANDSLEKLGDLAVPA